jgi:hypothetical protein
MARVCPWIGGSGRSHNPDKLWRARARGTVVRHQDQENLRADADPDAAEKPQKLDDSQENRGPGKIAYAKAVARSGEITVAFVIKNEKSFFESQSRREAPAGHVPFAVTKEKILWKSGSGEDTGANCFAFAEEKHVFTNACPGFLAEHIP